MVRRVLLVAGAALVVAGFVGSTHAADEPAHLIKYRQALMQAQQAHFDALVAIAKGEISAVADAHGHALAISATSQMLLANFAPGSGSEAGQTKARPEIWQNG